MKISEHLLCILAAAGPMESVQFDRWLAELRKSGYVDRGPGMTWILTEKAERLLSNM